MTYEFAMFYLISAMESGFGVGILISKADQKQLQFLYTYLKLMGLQS